LEIKEVGEFGLIERIKSKLSLPHKDIIKGIGDDACVTDIQKGKALLSTTDTLIEGVHFDLRFTSAYNLGKKSLAVNISDIAAMGGVPRFFLISLGIPPKLSVEFIDEFTSGIFDVSHSCQTHIVGGDTSFSPDRFFINITILGEAFKGDVICRDNAHVADQIFVTGNLGDSALGLKILMDRNCTSKVEEIFKELIEKHLCPTPRVSEGKLIAKNRIATAMIDISDGLISDLEHICNQSKVGAKIWIENLPLSDAFQKYSLKFTDTPIDMSLCGGEDYELLFTVDRKKMDLLRKIMPILKTKVTHIGEIVEQKNGITVLHRNGQVYPVKRKGFDHFPITFKDQVSF
jgi:thiamine-monophosphate kinase